MESRPIFLVKPQSRFSRSGVALVIVLAILVLMSALVVSFVSSASTENTAAKTFAQGVEARQAAETATNLVISQIREATAAEGDTATWISQPGAIRTIASTSPANNFVFKLYSAEKLREKESEYKPQDEVVIDPTDPTNLKPGFVDINEPLLYPIPDATGTDPKYEVRYPIVNPHGKYTINGGKANPGEGVVEGFYCEDIADTKRKDASGNSLKLLPMPVKWLYILKDGTIAHTDATGKMLLPDGSAVTKDNPPVARTAFWTDDESSKINVNTASEGTYWDTPSVGTKQESGDLESNGTLATTYKKGSTSLNLSVSQPARGEYQRYPGHPATTCLSPAIRWLFPNYVYPEQPNSAGWLDKEAEYKEAIYRLSPRITGGPGTTRGAQENPEYIGAKLNGTMVPEKDRLFATIDEYFFRPDRTGRDTNDRYGLNDKDLGNPAFTPEKLEKLRFFLTANSRAPELNAFGKPRMTIWPINVEGSSRGRTTFDELAKFTSTLAGKAYYFTRDNPSSGPQGSPAVSPDALAGRNMPLYKYLQNITGKKLPWAGSSFQTKYGIQDRDQILTEIFDYIRCTNLVDTSETTAGAGKAKFTPFYWSGTQEASVPNAGSGQVIPLRIESQPGQFTQGFGRFVTVSEAAIIFYREVPQVGTGPITLRAVLVFDMFTPAQGYPGLMENYSMRVQGADIFRSVTLSTNAEVPLGFPRDAVNIVNVDAYSAPIGRMFMPFRGFSNQFLYYPTPAPAGWTTTAKTLRANGAPATSVLGAARITEYPFVSNQFTVPNGTTHFGFRGGQLTIDIYASLNPNANSVPVQTLKITLPDNVPTPQATNNRLPVPTAASTSFSGRVTKGINGGRNNLTTTDLNSGYGWIIAGDTIRGMEVGGVAKGDQRIVAGKINVPDNHFSKRGEVGATKPYDTGVASVHGLRVSRGQNYAGAAADGRLVAGAPYRTDRFPKVPASEVGVKMANGNLGDWDRGLSKNVSGAFIGKSDEGNVEMRSGSPGAGGRLPYFLGFGGYEEIGATYFSPNRLIASAVNFGSLPSRVHSGGSWETLLFRPPVSASEHRGSLAPADHYLLDLFQMPVVEPYAISEPFSTAGKINLNYEIAPFGYKKNSAKVGYIERKTALHALLKSTKMLIVPNGANSAGHRENPVDPTATETWRYDIDRKLTLKRIQDRIDSQGLFRTASEFTEIELYPFGLSVPNWGTFWAANALTGDNQRERPYATIYPRTTTRSNVFTVHTRAQSIRKSANTPVDMFDEELDQVTGEYRGSTIIERHLDPNDPALLKVNYDPADPKAKSLSEYYRFRIVNSKQFK